MGSISKETHTNTIIEKTRQGEITVNLVLTIKLDGDGISIAGIGNQQKETPIFNLEENKSDKVDFEIPDFDSDDMEILDFGKDE